LRYLALLGLGSALVLAACSSTPSRDETTGKPIATASAPARFKIGKPYKIDGKWYYPKHDPSYDVVGVASWYGDDFQGLATANGEVFDKNRITAAHTTLPLPSLVRVTNLANGKSLVMRVNDRGPFVDDRLIDLSQAAARELGYEQYGLAKVRVQFLKIADDANGVPPPMRLPASRPAPVLVAEADEASVLPVPSRAGPVVVASAAAPLPAAAPRRRAAAPQLASSTVPGDCPDGWVVQVGAYASSSTVRAIATEVSHLHSVRIEPAFAGSTPVARLRLGPLGSRKEASGILSAVHRLGHASAFAACATGNAPAVRISQTAGPMTENPT
jgi:rare lipoprotein A